MKKPFLPSLHRRTTSPWNAFSDMAPEMDRLFDHPMFAAGWDDKFDKFDFSPTCEMKETEDKYIAKFDLPGLDKDSIKVDLHNNMLTISGERKEEKVEDTEKGHFSELTYGSFLRTFTFPLKVNAEKVNAKHKNGVLTIKVEKVEPSQVRQIPIN